MNLPTMIYKKGGSFTIGGENFSTKVVDASEVEALEKEGWRCSPEEAKEAGSKPEKKPKVKKEEPKE
jgi:hypothetical protein